MGICLEARDLKALASLRVKTYQLPIIQEEQHLPSRGWAELIRKVLRLILSYVSYMRWPDESDRFRNRLFLIGQDHHPSQAPFSCRTPSPPSRVLQTEGIRFKSFLSFFEYSMYSSISLNFLFERFFRSKLNVLLPFSTTDA